MFFHTKKSFWILLIISVIFCLDLFIRNGRPSTFDGPTHLANIAQFTKALANGDFPVRWLDGFANYGMPMGIIVQQTTSYIGAGINLLFHNTVFSYNCIVLISTFLSSYLLFLFLTKYYSETASLIGSILFLFAPYRIINIYIRGALPEYVAQVFFPLVLLGLFYWIKQGKEKGLWLVGVGTTSILLTHPFTFVIGSFLFVPYGIWLCLEQRRKKDVPKRILLLFIPLLLSIGLSFYYLFPLFREIRFFYYGLQSHQIFPNQFVRLSQYISDHWFYFYKGDIEVRGHVIHFGFFELLLTAVSISIWVIKGMQQKKDSFLVWTIISFGILVFFTSQYATSFYNTIPLIGGIQHNWRMFTSIVYIPVFFLAYLLDQMPAEKRKYIFFLFLTCIFFMRIPQLYGKNYRIEPESAYYWTKTNLHGNILNTIWTGPTEKYPVQKQKGAIIAGQGKILSREERNSWRKYTVQAESQLRMADYTFYFPGWKVYIDKAPTIIEWQDENYRGVITYHIPPGKHDVLVVFSETKTRMIGNAVTLISIFSLFFASFFRKKMRFFRDILR